ncbi:MAG: thioredoxin domain-containing protein [Firmicutes bacterium]|nr:thioredoxin domain-containing protein [Bacillota bacterium]
MAEKTEPVESEVKKKPNRLIHEKSPYLLQHAYNPVDWHPWGEEAFEKAKTENKLIFLSIGYSTCHWCHVMEKESFENEEVAGLMNDAFVSIKVDREERPDLDSVYMKVCQVMTGGGGWPLNVIITPDKKPFFASTYIPRENRFGRLGMMDLIPGIKELWKLRRGEAEKFADEFISSLKEELSEKTGAELSENILHNAYGQLLRMFDEKHGGFGRAVKFPLPHNLTFLLRYWKRTGEKKALQMVEKTLSEMRRGGVYDHIGFGFHRYSVDTEWLVPHFEKMLYDQALLAIAYIEAYQAVKKEEYAKTVQEVFYYVLRDMKSTEGGFYSGEDADSEGEEGKFYLWSEEEIKSLLSEEDASLIKKVFNVEAEGNFVDEATGEKKKRNILHLKKNLSELADNFKMTEAEIQNRIESARDKLFAAREKRIHPDKDDKILTDWNGLMIAALARGAQVFEREEYLKAAKAAADFILSKMRDSKGGLLHRYREGEFAIPAFLDDYAFLTWGLLEIYETSFEVHYLKSAIELNDFLLKHFRDAENGGFYLTSDEAESFLIRNKDVYDGAIPSGNSVSMMNLIRMGRITGNPEFEKNAVSIGQAFSKSISQAPASHTQLLSAFEFALGPSSEVVIAGDSNSEDTKAMLKALRSEYIPDKIVILRPGEEELPEIVSLAEYTKELVIINGETTAYVCRNFKCNLPTTEVGRLMENVKKLPGES